MNVIPQKGAVAAVDKYILTGLVSFLNLLNCSACIPIIAHFSPFLPQSKHRPSRKSVQLLQMWATGRVFLKLRECIKKSTALWWLQATNWRTAEIKCKTHVNYFIFNIKQYEKNILIIYWNICWCRDLQSKLW